MGRFRTRPGWVDRSLLYRSGLDLENQGSVTDDYVARLPWSELDASFLAVVTANGTDFSASDPKGPAQPLHLASVSSIDGVGFVDVRLATLQSGANRIWIYSGSSVASAVDDELAFYGGTTAPVDYFPVGSFGATNLTLVSLLPGNFITNGADSAPLGFLVPLSDSGANLGPAISASLPIAGSWDGTLGDAIVPSSFAGQEFVIPSPWLTKR